MTSVQVREFWRRLEARGVAVVAMREGPEEFSVVVVLEHQRDAWKVPKWWKDAEITTDTIDCGEIP
jgi:hypothetical protein